MNDEAQAPAATDYVVIYRNLKSGNLQAPASEKWTPVKGEFRATSKENAIKAAFAKLDMDTDQDPEFKAIPLSSWRETFEVDPEPRIRKKK